MLPQLIKLKGLALDLLFPQWCVSCGREGELWCLACHQSLPRIAPPICPCCGQPQSGGALCPGCLAGLLRDYLEDNPIPADVMVPLPLHAKRLRERGYNQSSLLAQALGRMTGITVVDNYLKRRMYAPPQTKTATLAERRSNVALAVACGGPSLETNGYASSAMWLTTGASADACTEALKASGAASVWVLVLDREL